MNGICVDYPNRLVMNYASPVIVIDKSPTRRVDSVDMVCGRTITSAPLTEMIERQ